MPANIAAQLDFSKGVRCPKCMREFKAERDDHVREREHDDLTRARVTAMRSW